MTAFSEIHRHVLIIGPDYKDSRGGIGSIIGYTSRQYKYFNFIPSYRYYNKYFSPIYSLIQLIYLPFYLLFHPVIRILHIHGASRGSFIRKYIIFLTAKYLFNKKIIYHIHGGEFHIFYSQSGPMIKRMIRHFLNYADCVFCLSKSWEKFFSEHFHSKQLKVIPNFVDDAVQSINQRKKEKPIFLFLGKIVKGKGIYDLFEVVTELAEAYPSKFELWVGGNGEIDEFRKLIKAHHMQKIVHFKGWVSGEAKTNILQQAAVYVLPSYNEGMPISILEAMSYGMPVIASRVGGIPEMIEDQHSGLLIEPGNKTQLREAMERLILEPELISIMGKKSKDIFNERYAASRIMHMINDTYESLLKNQAESAKK
jgi:glycosyltransferase involved in cell wall biosynthesis